MISEEYQLDASALLAVMLNEPGHERVQAVVNSASIHAVNVAEVIAKLMRAECRPTRRTNRSRSSISTSVRSLV